MCEVSKELIVKNYSSRICHRGFTHCLHFLKYIEENYPSSGAQALQEKYYIFGEGAEEERGEDKVFLQLFGCGLPDNRFAQLITLKTPSDANVQQVFLQVFPLSYK